MKAKKLNEYLQNADYHKKCNNELYWNDVWESYVEERSEEYNSLSTKEALARMISEQNLKERKNAINAEELGVWIRVGDICFIDYGINYINESGFQHFGLIISMQNNKVCVIPMTSNERICYEAKNKYKSHLYYLGKIEGMSKSSTLFLNDAKYINSARIIDVKAHIDTQSSKFKNIKNAFLETFK